MDNNDILRRIRYIFDFDNPKMMNLFNQGGAKVTAAEVSGWLRKEDHEEFASINDKMLSHFLNGLVIDKRGKKDDEEPKADKTLTNNLIFKKLKIALAYRDEDILKILDLTKVRISKHELSAFFRNPLQSQYRLCKDQVLRNFLYGLQLKYRPEPDPRKLK